jgi:hypothetical protein
MLLQNIVKSVKNNNTTMFNLSKFAVYGHNNTISKSNTLYLYGNNNILVSCNNVYDAGYLNKFSNSLIIKSPDESLNINSLGGNNFYHDLRYDFGSDFVRCDKSNGEVIFHGIPFISRNTLPARIYFHHGNFYINQFMIPKSNDLKKIIIDKSNLIYVKENVIYFV